MGKDIWQIRNIIKFSTGQTSIPIDYSEPKFEEAQPQMIRNIPKALVALALGILISVLFLIKWIYLLSLFIAVGIVIYSLDKSKKKMDKWAKQKNIHDNKLKKWQEISKNPPIVHSLSLETISTSTLLFYTYNFNEVESIVGAIKQAMTNKLDKEEMEIEVNAIDPENKSQISAISNAVAEQVEKEIKALPDTPSPQKSGVLSSYLQDSSILSYLKDRLSKSD